MGLVGAAGALPHHYTASLLRRIRDKDVALRDFLDLFHHRLLSLFYRAWGKYRLPLAYERSKAESGAGEDPGSRALFCLVGLAPESLRGRVAVDDEVFLHYAGHIAHHPRSATALEALLADYFAMPIRVVQMVGQWLHLDVADRSRLAAGGNNRLGEVVVGRRVWDVQGKIRLRVGPLSRAEFRRLLPDGTALRPLGQLARTYAGPELDIDVQPVLRAEEVPWCRLDGSGPDRPRLGWNTWVRRRPFEADVTGPTFSLRPDEEALTITPRPIFLA
jgi:type VI secretion system protein ImpH